MKCNQCLHCLRALGKRLSSHSLVPSYPNTLLDTVQMYTRLTVVRLEFHLQEAVHLCDLERMAIIILRYAKSGSSLLSPCLVSIIPLTGYSGCSAGAKYGMLTAYCVRFSGLVKYQSMHLRHSPFQSQINNWQNSG